jgi:hypothetical protein
MEDVLTQSGDLTAITNDGEQSVTQFTGDIDDTDGQNPSDSLTDGQVNPDTTDSFEQNPQETPEVPEVPEQKYFTQDELDNIVRSRVERERQNALKNDPARSFMEQEARKLGVSVEALVEATRQQQAEQEALMLAEQHNISPEIAAYIQRTQQMEAQRASEAQNQAMLQDFVRQYPTVHSSQISAETWEQVHAGKPLADAYAHQRLQELNAENEKLRKGMVAQQANSKNKLNSPSAVGGAVGKGDFIPYDVYKTMSIQEIYDNYDKVEASRKQWE